MMELHVPKKQMQFIRSTAFETLFGGAAGGTSAGADSQASRTARA